MATSSERASEHQLQGLPRLDGGGCTCAGLLRVWVGSYHTGRGEGGKKGGGREGGKKKELRKMEGRRRRS